MKTVVVCVLGGVTLFPKYVEKIVCIACLYFAIDFYSPGETILLYFDM